MEAHPVPPHDDAGDEALLAWLRAEVAHPFEGWDFSHLAGRMEQRAPPWDYARIVAGALPGCHALLDLGTGGGEFLSTLRPLPPLTRATEGYAPNVPIARARLEPLGVAAHEVGDDGALPFAGETFDLVINRHESYDPREVRRVLRKGGRFITQQVGGANDSGLNRLLGAPDPDDGFADNVKIGIAGRDADPPDAPSADGLFASWTLAFAGRQLEAEGFRIATAAEAFPVTRFADAGAIVYYLKAVPWQIPDFGVERYFARLKDLHRRCRAEGGIAIRGHRFLLVAERPA